MKIFGERIHVYYYIMGGILIPMIHFTDDIKLNIPSKTSKMPTNGWNIGLQGLVGGDEKLILKLNVSLPYND